MFAFGFLGLLVGAYLIDSAVKGRPPIATLKELITDPSNVRGVLANNAGVLTPASYETPSTSDNFAVEAMDTSGDAATTGGSESAAATGKAKTVISFAEKQIGKPYRWGGNGPNSWDCSGLTVAAYRTVGVSLPRTTYGQVTKGSAVSKSDLAPGDLVFPAPGHVQIYIGGGKVIEAPRTGLDVRKASLGRVWKARRVL